jgi:hypothetical protein
MNDIIKTWEYTEHRDQKSRLELYSDKVLEYSYYNPKQSRARSFDEVFTNPYPIGNLQVDYELLKYLVNLADREKLSVEGQYSFDFYSVFDNTKIREEELELESKVGDFARYFSCMTPYGVSKHYEREDGEWNQSRQRFFSFFFYGPEITKLPFEVRKRWREMVWKALGDKPPFNLDEGFALFDYDKIQPKTFNWHSSERDEGEYVEIHKDQIMMGGWSGRDGGGSYSSIERVWYFENSILSNLQSHTPEIKAILELAIVAGRKTTAIRVPPAEVKTEKITIIETPENKAEGGQEAPPA